jgi:hypothetical protein
VATANEEGVRPQRSVGRVALVLIATGLLGVAALAAFVAWTYSRSVPTLVVTNGCGYAVFADNGQDGFEIANGDTARFDKVGAGLVDLGRAPGDRSLRITVGPPTTLEGPLCP